MARKKKKSTHRRRRSVGALSMKASSPLVKYGPILLGFLAAKPINTAIDGIIPASLKAKPNFDKMAGIVEGGLGAYLIFGKTGRASMMKSVLGGIALGAGAKRLMDSLKAGVAGYGAVPVIGNSMNGYGKVPVIGNRKVSGYTPNAALNGYTPNANLSGQKPVHQQVMGDVNGDGYSNGGSNCMQ